MSILWACSIDRPHIARPWFDGDRVIATDGHVCVSLPASDVPHVVTVEAQCPNVAAGAQAMLVPEGVEHVTSATALLAWAGEPEERCTREGCPGAECQRCDGRGWRYSHDGECADCGSDRLTCQECDDGKTVCACGGHGRVRDARVGTLYGVPVDRRLIARTLLALDASAGAGDVVVTVQFDSMCPHYSKLWLSHGAGVALVMPIRPIGVEDEAKKYSFPPTEAP